MKRNILYIAFLVALAGGVNAQNFDGFRVADLDLIKNGDTAEVVFTGHPEEGSPAGVTRVYRPVITDGRYRVSLPPVVLRGKRAATAWERREWANRVKAEYAQAVYPRKNEAVDYRASVPFQVWMHEARLEMETLTAGCGESFEERFVIAGHSFPAAQPVAEPEPVIPEPEIPAPTTGEVMAETFPFVLPASDFDPKEPIRFYDDERDNSLTLFYRINSYHIEPDYTDNQQTLVNLMAAIEVIRNSPNSRVSRVVVAGFASPEGPFEFNDRLAWERAVSVKEYILKNSAVEDHAVTLFNGSADWRGLRLLVESDRDLPGRREVLRIMDSHPLSDAATQKERMERIRRLSNGETYAYMAEHIFPLLRNGTFIRVYFENK